MPLVTFQWLAERPHGLRLGHVGSWHGCPGQNRSGGYLGHGGDSENYSEETAQKIDVIIRDMIQDQYNRALKIINDKRNALDVIAQSLLEYETIDGKHVLEIIEHVECSPIVKREIQSKSLRKMKRRAKCLRNLPSKTMIIAASQGRSACTCLTNFLLRPYFSYGVKHGYIPLTWKRISLIS